MTRENIRSYIQKRANELGFSLSEVCRRAGVSRQTLYSLDEAPHKLPTLQTVVNLASVLLVHPLRLLQLVFDELPMPSRIKRRHERKDESAFIQENIPDGTLVMFRQRFTKTWQLQNMGRTAWENRYLQCMDQQVEVYALAGDGRRETGDGRRETGDGRRETGDGRKL